MKSARGAKTNSRLVLNVMVMGIQASRRLGIQVRTHREWGLELELVLVLELRHGSEGARLSEPEHRLRRLHRLVRMKELVRAIGVDPCPNA